jgi:hypothetical protein
MRLMTALAGSGFMCHVSNTFLKSRMPSADDVLRQNPDLARQFAAAAANQAGPGFGNFMGMAMGQTQGQGQGQGGAAPNPAGAGNAGAFFQPNQQQRAPQAVASVEAQQAQAQQQTARREMKGPSGVDDILSAFQQARERDMSEVPQTSASQGAVAAAVEIQSMHSEDIQSMAESTRTGRTGGRRRRPAVGNTVSLQV